MAEFVDADPEGFLAVVASLREMTEQIPIEETWSVLVRPLPNRACDEISSAAPHLCEPVAPEPGAKRGTPSVATAETVPALACGGRHTLPEGQRLHPPSTPNSATLVGGISADVAS